jgi:hypothetical protein
MLRKYSLALSLFLIVIVPALVLSAGTASAADEVFKATTAITLPNGQNVISFDISYVDPVIGVYILADRTNKSVDVIDTATNTVLVQLTATPAFRGANGNNDTSGPDGVLIINHREVWAGDGDSTIKVIDLISQKTTHVIHTGGVNRADELCFDPRHHLVLMANDAELPFPFVTFISTKTYSVVGKITMDGTGGTPKATNGIEQCQWSRRTGKFYLNIPEVNGPGDNSAPGAVVVLSPETMQVEKIFNIDHDNCAGPQGMAIGPENEILLGCNSASGNGRFSTVIINERSGHIIATLDNESGADEVWFNDGDDHYFLARSAAHGDNQLLGVVDAQDKREDQSVFTATKVAPVRNAHSVAADPVMNQVYVPIPAGRSTVCSSAGGNDAQGCIAVFTTKNDDRPAR